MATYKKQLKDQNGDNIIPALGTASVTGTNIDWSTFQRPTTEVVAGKWCDGSTIYAQHFTGTFTVSTSGRVTVNLLSAGSAKMVIKVEGSYDASGSNAPTAFIGPTLSTSAFKIDAIANLDVASDGRLRFMVSAQSYGGQTGCYDLVVYYTKP